MSTNNEVLDHFFKNNQSKSTTVDEIVMIVDRSGSMEAMLEDAQGGINSFLRGQREVGEANVTVVEFDHEYNVVHDRARLSDIPEYTLVPRGMTALLDAIGRAMNTYRDVETDGKKIAVVVTDGCENSSKEWTRESIKDLIETLKEKGWEFVFLAADQSTIEDAMTYGFGADTSITMSRGVEGSSMGAYAAAHEYATSLRTGKSKAEAVQDLDKVVENIAGLSKVSVDENSQS